VWRTGHDAELVHRHSVTDATAAEPSAEVGVAVGVEERRKLPEVGEEEVVQEVGSSKQLGRNRHN